MKVTVLLGGTLEAVQSNLHSDHAVFEVPNTMLGIETVEVPLVLGKCSFPYGSLCQNVRVTYEQDGDKMYDEVSSSEMS